MIQKREQCFQANPAKISEISQLKHLRQEESLLARAERQQPALPSASDSAQLASIFVRYSER